MSANFSFPRFPNEYIADSLNGVIAQFDRLEAPQSVFAWIKSAPPQRRICKLGVPPKDRDAALKKLAAMEARLPSWEFSVGSPSPGAKYSITVIDAPTTVTSEIEGKTGLAGLLELLRARVTREAPIAQPSAPEDQVKKCLETEVASAFGSQPPLPGQQIERLTVRYLYETWKPPLLRLAPQLLNLFRKSEQVKCTTDFDVKVEYIFESIDPDVLRDMQKKFVAIELKYAPLKACAPVVQIDPSTAPPDDGNWTKSLPRKLVKVIVRNVKTKTKAAGEVLLDQDGVLTLQQVPGSELTTLLKEVQVDQPALSRDPAKALRLQITEAGAEVISLGEPKRFDNLVGPALQVGIQLPFPIQLRASFVHVDIQAC